MTKIRSKVVLIAIIAMSCFSTLLFAHQFNKIVVFGDSLSDNGNLYEYMQHKLPNSPPYYNGRFTNGLVWVELLAKQYFPQNSAEHLLDYAFGGASVVGDVRYDDSVITLSGEVDSYLLTHQGSADAQSLYIIWAGSNNYLSAPDEIEDTVDQVIQNIQYNLQRLATHGAKYIIVMNIPNLSKIPAANYFNVEALFNALSQRHNARLKQVLHKLQNTYPTVNWKFFDVNALFTEILASPDKFGFSNTIDACYDASINPQIIDCQGYLFVDLVHPTVAAHLEIAKKMHSILSKAPFNLQRQKSSVSKIRLHHLSSSPSRRPCPLKIITT